MSTLLVQETDSDYPTRRDYQEPGVAARFLRVAEARAQANVAGQTVTRPERVGRLAGVRHLVAVGSGKGGVGKSTLTANLALACARRGLRVGVLDADINAGTVARLLGITRVAAITSEGLLPAVGALDVRVMSMDLFIPEDPDRLPEALTWRHLREEHAVGGFLADTQWGELDVLLVDLPPGPGRLAGLAEMLPGLSGALLVTLPGDVTHRALRRALATLREMQVRPLGLVVNLAGHTCAHCGAQDPLFGAGDEAQIAAHLGLPLLGSVPYDLALARVVHEGAIYLQDCWDAPAALAVRKIAGALVEELDWP
jgi:ATP-binding protein involved in chromosome partitioning